MWWSIAVGIACVVSAIYLLIAERRPRQRYTYRRPSREVSPRRVEPIFKETGLLLWDAVSFVVKLIAVFVGRLLYGLYLVLKVVATKSVEAGHAAARKIRRRRSAPDGRKGITQQKQSQEDTVTLTEETITRIQKEGLLRYLKGK